MTTEFKLERTENLTLVNAYHVRKVTGVDAITDKYLDNNIQCFKGSNIINGETVEVEFLFNIGISKFRGEVNYYLSSYNAIVLIKDGNKQYNFTFDNVLELLDATESDIADYANCKHVFIVLNNARNEKGYLTIDTKKTAQANLKNECYAEFDGGRGKRAKQKKGKKSSSTSQWSRTGRKTTDGCALWRNAKTGELRVRKMVVSKKDGSRKARYVKPTNKL